MAMATNSPVCADITRAGGRALDNGEIEAVLAYASAMLMWLRLMRARQCQAAPSPGNGGARMVEQPFHTTDAASHPTPTRRAICPSSSCMRGLFMRGLFMIVNVLKFAPMGRSPCYW